MTAREKLKEWIVSLSRSKKAQQSVAVAILITALLVIFVSEPVEQIMAVLLIFNILLFVILLVLEQKDAYFIRKNKLVVIFLSEELIVLTSFGVTIFSIILKYEDVLLEKTGLLGVFLVAVIYIFVVLAVTYMTTKAFKKKLK